MLFATAFVLVNLLRRHHLRADRPALEGALDDDRRPRSADRGPPDAPAAATRRLRLAGGGFWRALWGSRSGRIGLILVGITLLGALVSILGLAPVRPAVPGPDRHLEAPSLDHWLGTDSSAATSSRSCSRASCVSLEIAVLATLIAGVLGTLGGIVAGYLGGIDLDA